MAAAKMRHYNSPDELAKRAGEEPSARQAAREFKHYNHPDEVAKRAAEAERVAAARLPGQAVRPKAPPVKPQLPEWPPAGTVDNTAPSLELRPPPMVPQAKSAPVQRGDFETRLRRLEVLLWTFVETEAEARDFRMLLNNQQAVTDAQLEMAARVRAIELAIQEAEDELADDAPELPELELEPDAPAGELEQGEPDAPSVDVAAFEPPTKPDPDPNNGGA